MTQLEMADALGIQNYTLSRYLSGTSRARSLQEAERLVGAAMAHGITTTVEMWLRPLPKKLIEVLNLRPNHRSKY